MAHFMHYLTRETSVDFIRIRSFAYALTAVLIVGSLFSIFTKGLNFGIDFKGGILIELKASEKIDVEKMRGTLSSKTSVGDFNIQSVGEDGTEVLIRALGKDKDEAAQKKTIDDIREALGGGYEYRRVEMVGPVVGEELRKDSIWAAFFAVLAISLYVWFRFEWQFALGAIISLVHDVIVLIGLFSVFQLDFNLTIVAAILTVIGYSINDTVVCYDRIRETIRKHRKMDIKTVLNKSLNSMMGRTLLTGMTTLIAVIIMFFLGGEVLRGFALTMIVGVLIGTFSSVFVSVPILYHLDLQNMRLEETEKQA